MIDDSKRLVRSFQLAEVIAQRIKDGVLKLDLGGHFATGINGEHLDKINKYTKEWIFDRLEILHPADGGFRGEQARKVRQDESLRLLDHWDDGKPLDKPVVFWDSSLFGCGDCGQNVAFSCDGETLAAQPCPYPDGYPPIDFELNCPSGKMVVANDLREYFKVIDNFDINRTSGIAACTLAYAKVGLAHGFVGNTSPGVFAVGGKNPTSFLIGNTAEGRETLAGPHSRRARRVAGVCTDLWWYSICDYDEFVRRAGHTPEEDKRECEVIDCRPGVYRFRQIHHLIKDADDWRKAHIYCLVDRMRAADPVAPLAAVYDALEFTAEEVVGDHAHRWYTKRADLNSAIIRAVDHLMCVIGNGAEHHRNGWVGFTQNVDTSKAVEIPQFDSVQRWYPLCGYSVLAEMSGLAKTDLGEDVHLNPSFVRLGFNIVRNILVYGMDPTDTHCCAPTDDIEKVRAISDARQYRWAWHIYLGLKNRYPDQIPDNCLDLPKPSVPDIDEVPR